MKKRLVKGISIQVTEKADELLQVKENLLEGQCNGPLWWIMVTDRWRESVMRVPPAP